MENTESNVKMWVMGAAIAVLIAISGWLMVDKITNNDGNLVTVTQDLNELSSNINVLREDVLVKLAYLDGRNSVQDMAIETNEANLKKLMDAVRLNTEARLQHDRKE